MAENSVFASRLAAALEVERERLRSTEERRLKTDAFLAEQGANALRNYVRKELGLNDVVVEGNTLPLTPSGEIVLYAHCNLSPKEGFDPDDEKDKAWFSKTAEWEFYIKPAAVPGEPYDNDWEYPEFPRFSPDEWDADEHGYWVGMYLGRAGSTAWERIARFFIAWEKAFPPKQTHTTEWGEGVVDETTLRIVALKASKALSSEFQEIEKEALLEEKRRTFMTALGAKALREYARNVLDLEITPTGDTYPLTSDGEVVLYADARFQLSHDFDPEDEEQVAEIEDAYRPYSFYIKPRAISGVPSDDYRTYSDLPRFDDDGEYDPSEGHWVGIQLGESHDLSWRRIAHFIDAWQQMATKAKSKQCAEQRCDDARDELHWAVFKGQRYAWASVETLNALAEAGVHFMFVRGVNPVNDSNETLILIESYAE